MTTYLSFLLFATLLAVAPGPDTFLTLRASVLGGRRRGLFTAAGITLACAAQGILAASGLGAVIAHAEPAFQAIRWAGVAYLTWLGITALRSALHRDGGAWAVGPGMATVSRRAAFRQGFVCNITNPKVLAFNLAVLPQFVSPGQGLPALLAYALTLVAVGAVVLLVVIEVAHAAATRLVRPAFRRTVDGTTGAVMLGFATALAVES
ncbi:MULTISPECIES: LysE family translocator [Aeromicrobium]|uniref:LysE family translocator n=1 Tax=Aeromicrobium phoceense TaxID=2754045 RepID=A0A838XF34_9ACTN|nr:MULTISPECIES: LysE family translocator [Aeromicrobium]MBA4607511.1 LysE family translocator [Aeromicrobium phoceense]